MDKKSLLLVASPGGHFVQLSLLAEGLMSHNLIIVGTYADKPKFMPGHLYEKIEDFSRDDFYKAFGCFFECIRVVKRHKPDLIVTTGAAPGLAMFIVGRFLGVKTVWIDSIANSKKLSLSGKITKLLGGTVLSQWPDVADEAKVKYKGRVI